MSPETTLEFTTIPLEIKSIFLDRTVIIDCYIAAPLRTLHEISILFVNDGQDLRTMNFENIYGSLLAQQKMRPIFCVGIHCSKDRKNEYGTAQHLDYKGRGAKAGLYQLFIMEELIPFLRKQFNITSIKEKAFAGFSLGGLAAIDLVWNYPLEFSYAAVFSGSLWWRDKDQDEIDFNEDTDRIMHRLIREGIYYPHLKFFFEVGTKDETQDRNNNGIIDSIDDTLSLINELEEKGYQLGSQIKYVELADGKHDVPTWAIAFPHFLTWAWGTDKVI